ncbi:MAG: PAS domain S-box protein [Saprospiraceae bacterium]
MDNFKMLQAMFVEATIGILVVDAQGEIVQANPFSEKLFGYEKGELISQKIEVLLPQSFRKRHTDYRKNYHHNPVPRTMGANLELYGLRKDGTQFPIEISLSHMDIDGERFAIAYASDHSVQQEIMRDLNEAKKMSDDVSKIIEESLNELFIFDAQTLKFIQVNKGALLNIGYTLEEMKMLTPIDIKPYIEKKELLELTEPLKNGDVNILLFETIHERKDQTTYPVEVHLQYSHLGKIPVFVAFILDISQRKNYELKILRQAEEMEKKVIERTQELRASEVKLLEAQKTAKVGNWEFDINNQIIRWSEQLYHNFEWEKDSLVSVEKILKSIHSDDFSKMAASIKKIQETGQPRPLNFRIITSKGEVRYMYANGHPIINSNKPDEKKMRGIIQDVTELKEAELALQKSEVQLKIALEKERELGELKSRFVSMASHEFRTPLSSILSSANIIGHYKQEVQQDKRMKHVNRIESSVRNLTVILNDFLSLEKLESGNIRYQPITFEIKNYIQQIVEEINITAKNNQKIIHLHEGNSQITADEHLLKNILLNLLSNGIKYSPAEKNVELITKKKEGKFTIQVKDYGIGIPEADQKNMFTRFFRAKNVTNIQGTGLGLTIVSRYLDLMNGKIWFESKEGKGTTFFVEIPQ